MVAATKEFTPGEYASFPTGIDSLRLETFSLARLENGDEALEEKLFETCKTRGFFYLDMRDSQHSSLVEIGEAVVRIGEEVFKLPLEEKQKYTGGLMPVYGYKAAGRARTDAADTPDLAEFFNIAKDGIIVDNVAPPGARSWPAPVQAGQPVIERFAKESHSCGMVVLAALGRRLGLPSGTFEALHRIREPSTDSVRVSRGPPNQTAEGPMIFTPGHTDATSITLLWNWVGGLQIWTEPDRGLNDFKTVIDPIDQGRWVWVEPPPPGHIIINLGDAAVQYSGGLLCSARHRVLPPPGEQGRRPRYSLVYFVRPEDAAVLKRLEAPGIPAGRFEDDAVAMTFKDYVTQHGASFLRRKVAA